MSPRRVFNFGAGPAMLPTPVLETVQAELLDFEGLGVSVMELSHGTASDGTASHGTTSDSVAADNAAADRTSSTAAAILRCATRRTCCSLSLLSPFVKMNRRS